MKNAKYHADYYRRNAEKLKTRARIRWREDPDAKLKDKNSRDKRRDKIRAYDRMRAERDREKNKLILQRWIENNPDRYRAIARASAHRRRTRQAAACGTHSCDDIAALLHGQKGRCWWCGIKVNDHYHVDHRLPISKGGSNDKSNLVISCAPCNRRKGAKMPWEFMGRLL